MKISTTAHHVFKDCRLSSVALALNSMARKLERAREGRCTITRMTEGAGTTTASMWLSFRLNRQGSQAECLLEDALPGWLQMISAELDAYQVPIYNSLGYLAIGVHIGAGRGFAVGYMKALHALGISV